MIVGWSWILVMLSIISKSVMTAPPLRNYFRQWLTVQSRVMGTRLNLEEPRSEASFVKRPDHWLLQPGLNETSTRKTVWEPCHTCQTRRATVRGECYEPKHGMQLVNRVTVKTDSWPSSALPRRQFRTSRRAFSALWSARLADWKWLHRLLFNKFNSCEA